MSINIPKGRFYFKNTFTSGRGPSDLTIAIISQFATCTYFEERIPIPEFILYLN